MATLITNLTTVATNGPSAVTTANAIAPAGPIEDYPGMVQNALLKAQELKIVVANLILNTDATTDAANLALLNAVQADLV